MTKYILEAIAQSFSAQ